MDTLLMPIYRPKYYEHGVYHIYNRGVAKLPTFLHDDDYHDFQDILRYLAIGFPLQKDAILPVKNPHLPVTYKADPLSNGLFRPLIDIIAYCLMPNHFHLVVQIKQPVGQIRQMNGSIASFYSIPELIRRLCITYSHKFNRKYGREGALFQGRFRIKHIPEDRDVLQVVRYVHINPVVAGLVVKPEEWLFGDYHVYVKPGSMRSFQVTNTNLVLSYFDGDVEQYKEFVHAVISEQESKLIAKYIIDQDKDQS